MSTTLSITLPPEAGWSQGYEEDITVDTNSDTDVVKQITKEALKFVTEHVKTHTHYQRYEVNQHEDLSSDVMQDVFLTAITNGREQYQQALKDDPDTGLQLSSFVNMELADGFEQKQWWDDQAHEALTETFGPTFDTDLAENIREAAAEQGIDLSDEQEGALASDIYDRALQTVWDNDESSPLDVLKQADDITMVYIPSDPLDGGDEVLVQSDAITGNAARVIPDEGFRAMLSMINLQPFAYVAAVRDQSRGLIAGETDPSEAGLQPVVNLYDDPDHGDAWEKLLGTSYADLGIEPTSPPSLTAEHLIEVIDNTNGYGTPVLVVKLSPEQLMDMKPDDTLEISNGGMVGVHDFANGSGHLMFPDTPVLVKADPSDWVPAAGPNSPGQWDLNDVYGMSESAFEASVKVIPAERAPESGNNAPPPITPTTETPLPAPGF